MKKNILKLKINLFSSQYNLKYLRADLLSSFGVALLALPQSIAYALIVGLPVHCGILAAISGAILTSSFGHSKHLISGPTNATALVIQSGTSHILYQHFYGLSPDLKGFIVLQITSQIVLFIGIIQILISLFKLGGFTQFISRSVMMGYILGVTISIWVSQIYQILSIHKPIGTTNPLPLIPYLGRSLHQLNPYTTLLGIFSLLLMILLKNINTKVPRAFITLFCAGTLAYITNSFISSESAIPNIAAPHFHPKNLFNFHLIYFEKPILQDMLFISFAIALLSIFEVNSISRLISAKSGQSTNSNKDILGVGMSNFVSSFFLGTLPSSGSPSRSIYNYQNGAKTRFSGVLSGIFVILIIALFYPFIRFIPITSVAALLLMIGYEIIDFKLLKICLRATKRDALVLVVTCISCLIFQPDIALFIGIALSLILYLRLSAQTNILEYVFTEEGHFKPVEITKDRFEKRIRILNMEGNLFFGSIDDMQKKLTSIVSDPEVKILILRFSNVQHLDASICHFLEVFASNLKKEGKSLYLCEMLRSTIQVVHESPHLKNLGHEYLYEMDDSSPIKATQKAFAHALNKLNSAQKTPS